jgi:hypothetical protein
LTTPGFSAEGVAAAHFYMKAMSLIGPLPGSEPSLIVGDPAEINMNGVREDDGRTVRVKSITSVRVYCKRDDYPEGPVFTFLRADEY